MSVNKVILLGNVGKDPEVRYPQQGQAVASFTLATNERGYTTGQNAEIAERYIRKGSPLYIEGKLRTRVWEDRNQIKRTVTEIYAEVVELVGRRQESQP